MVSLIYKTIMDSQAITAINNFQHAINFVYINYFGMINKLLFASAIHLFNGELKRGKITL